jgi:hypothetical protein
MVTAPTADELYASAAKFAQSALDAHHKGEHQRVAIDAGTALEHLTKACLARRSPALLAELKAGPNNWASLALLCGYSEATPTKLRTVGLREARDRAKTFVKSVADESDLALLVDLRDGVVHAAVDVEVEERLLVAFVQQSDAILADMRTPRAFFWAGQLSVVDALLADASDKVAYRVQVKLATAKAASAAKYREIPAEVREFIKGMTPLFDEMKEAIADCPACGAQGVARGDMEVDAEAEADRDGVMYASALLVFTPVTFSCQQCGLRLTSQAELAAAGVPHHWERPELDVSNYLAWDWGEDFG